jgi:hypothetical protein
MKKLPDDPIVSAPDFSCLVQPEAELGLDETDLPFKDWPI